MRSDVSSQPPVNPALLSWFLEALAAVN